MELIGATLGLSLAVWILVAVITGILFPAFWLWMVIDALVRDTVAYPGRDISEKVLWVVLMLVLQPAAVLYFLVVWRKEGSAFSNSRASSPMPTGAASV